MFLRFKPKRWLLAVLPAVLLIAAGCQSIGGVDLSKALMNQLIVDSVQAKMDISLKITPDEATIDNMTTEEQDMLHALNGMKLILDEVKQENWQKASFKGRLVLIKGEIGFRGALDAMNLTLQVDGIDAPVVLPLAAQPLTGGEALGLGPLSSVSNNTELLQNKELAQSMFSLLVKHLPNPSSIKAESVSETVYGSSSSVQLTKIHTEIKATELLGLFKKLVVGLLKDDTGLKEVIAKVYDVAIAPDLAKGGTEDDFLGINELMKDRELGIEFIHATVKQFLILMVSFAEGDDALGKELNEMFSDETGMITDLYFDSSLNLRKTHMAIKLAPSPTVEDTDGISSIELTMNSEYWNHNQAVKADVIDTSGTTPITLDQLDAPSPALLERIDPDSTLYKWLKEDLHLMKKTVLFDVSEFDYSPEEQKAVYANGIIYVPARYFADSLGLAQSWDAASRSLTLSDAMNGTKLTLTVDADNAVLNGQSVDLATPAFNQNGRVYVPLRFVVDAFDATIVWDNIWETATVTKE